MNEDYSAQDPRDEVCNVVEANSGRELPQQLSRANAESYAALLNEAGPFNIEYVTKCAPVGVVDAINSLPENRHAPQSFAPSAGSRGV